MACAALPLIFAGCVSPEKIKQSETTVLFHRGSTPTLVERGPIKLTVGESALVEVWSRLPANETRIAVAPGMEFRFLVPPGQVWTDFYVTKGASGYRRGPLAFIQERFASTKPLPDENWFCLVGAFNQPECFPFAIRTDNENPATITVHHFGQLVLFANDARSFYWNNFGRIQVVITRLN